MKVVTFENNQSLRHGKCSYNFTACVICHCPWCHWRKQRQSCGRRRLALCQSPLPALFTCVSFKHSVKRTVVALRSLWIRVCCSGFNQYSSHLPPEEPPSQSLKSHLRLSFPVSLWLEAQGSFHSAHPSLSRSPHSLHDECFAPLILKPLCCGS